MPFCISLTNQQLHHAYKLHITPNGWLPFPVTFFHLPPLVFATELKPGHVNSTAMLAAKGEGSAFRPLLWARLLTWRRGLSRVLIMSEHFFPFFFFCSRAFPAKTNFLKLNRSKQLSTENLNWHLLWFSFERDFVEKAQAKNQNPTHNHSDMEHESEDLCLERAGQSNCG